MPTTSCAAIAMIASLAAGLAVLGCGNDAGGPGDDSGEPPSCLTDPGWTAAPAVDGGAIQETATVAVDGKIYVLGGFDGARAVVDSVRIFDPAACTWSSGPDLPMPIHHANAAVVDGTIYVLGAMVTGLFTPIGDAWAWNPATDADWSPREGMPAGTQRGSAVVGVIDDVVYLAGGLRNGAVALLSSYTPATDTWATNLPPVPAINDHGCGGVVRGKLYVTGGRRGDIVALSDRVFEYRPGGDWLERAAMPTGRGGTACGVIGDRIIVAGGEGNSAAPSRVFPQVEAYDAVADRWESLAPMVTPRHGMGAAVVDGALYVPGGATTQGFDAVATHEVLRP